MYTGWLNNNQGQNCPGKSYMSIQQNRVQGGVYAQCNATG